MSVSRYVLLVALVVCVSATASSGFAQRGGKIATLRVTPESLTVNAGDIAQARCIPLTARGDTLKNTCTWKSTDTAVVRVTSGSQMSTLTARRNGAVTVTATAGGKSASLRVTVVPVASVVVPTRTIVAPHAFTVAVNSTQQMCAFIGFASGHIALRTADQARSPCPTEYAKLTLTQRSVTVEEQAAADRVCITWTATGGTITAEICGVPS